MRNKPKLRGGWGGGGVGFDIILKSISAESLVWENKFYSGYLSQDLCTLLNYTDYLWMLLILVSQWQAGNVKSTYILDDIFCIYKFSAPTPSSISNAEFLFDLYVFSCVYRIHNFFYDVWSIYLGFLFNWLLPRIIIILM